MGRLRFGGYQWVTWIGDHEPRHVHVYRDGRLIVKWDLDHDAPMEGEASARVLRLLKQLREAGKL